MNKIYKALIISLGLILLASAPVYADVPSIPCAFWGSVTINGRPAPTGTQIEAVGTGVLSDIEGNPITTTQSGQYGAEGGLSPKLIVQGDIEEGAKITFMINGTAAYETAVWHSGSTTRVDLTIRTSVGTSGTGGGGGNSDAPIIPTPSPLPGVINLNNNVDSTGKFTSKITAASDDGNVSITIDAGTIGHTGSGSPLTQLTINPASDLPDPPENAGAPVLSYDLGPNGASFDPAITIAFKYDRSSLPDDAVPYVSWYNASSNSWEKLTVLSIDTSADPAVITVAVNHFTLFSMFEEKAAVPVSPTPEVVAVESPVNQPEPVVNNATPSSEIGVPPPGQAAEINTPVQNPDTVPSIPSANNNSVSWKVIICIVAIVLIAAVAFVLIRKTSKRDKSR
jgi:hypothetical protein